MSQKNMMQNKWKMQRNLKIDERTREDLEKELGSLASCYVPEWQFSTENPDIGSTLGILFTGQMADNIGRLNQVIDKYHAEFVNMLGISFLPGKPARAVVLMDLVQDTIAGVEVKKQTKLFAGEVEDGLVYETAHNIYITNSRMIGAFMTIGKEGKVVPLVETEEETGANHLKQFVLFGKDEEGVEKNLLYFYHGTIFDVEQNPVYVKVIGGEALAAKIREGKYVFSYLTEEGMIPVEQVEALSDGETFLLHKEQRNLKLEQAGIFYSVLMLEAKEPVTESLPVKAILFSSAGAEQTIAFAGSGNTEYDREAFDPFGDTLSLYAECYLGHDEYFDKKGAHIRIAFDVSYPEHTVQLTRQQEEDELKIIKRKPRTVQADVPADAYAEEITIEYFNGIGWKKLTCYHEYGKLFAGEKQGHYEISFCCPEDWEAASVGAYEGRCIRLQILKSDNCYMRPCVHHYPHIEHMTVSYSYEDHYMQPERLFALVGTEGVDFTAKAVAGEPYTAFSKSKYGEDALYLGFNRKMQGGPVSLLFQMEDGIPYEGLKCNFLYSTSQGFKQMKVIDHTMGMSRSGIVMFMPQADMAPMTLEGLSAYWIKMTPEKEEESGRVVLPKILNIFVNAVEAYNIETRPEQEFYLEEVSPNMVFDLGVPNILDIDLWVNERGRLLPEEMQRMLEETPELVQVQKNAMGEVSAFYVKWEETDQLNRRDSGRGYVLDRLGRRLFFGDGVHMEIPRVLDDVAFKVVVRCCRGSEGNVEAGAIQQPLGNLPYIDHIINPMKAYGGSDMESIDSALERGGGILGGRKRLVSLQDYEREILAHSETIDKVKCVLGERLTGERDENSITFAVLLEDYRAGSYSFHNEAASLRKYLLESCELTINPDDLHIVEPVFVTVSVDVWAQISDPEESFGIQTLLQETMDDYLEPVGREGSVGWQIGTLPKKTQIMMKLSVLKDKVMVKKMTVTGEYTDETGSHERDLEEIEVSPFMICRSGIHRIHIMLFH